MNVCIKNLFFSRAIKKINSSQTIDLQKRKRRRPSPWQRSISSFVAICFLCATLLPTGCSTIQIPKYPSMNMEKYDHVHTVGNDLIVAIEPILDHEECTKYFAEDLLSLNILAVQVSVENRSQVSSYLFRKDRILLFTEIPASQSSELVDQVATLDAGKAMMDVGAYFIIGGLIIFPLLIVSPFLTTSGAGMISDAAETRHNFIVNELQTQTLSPGEKVHGFVYFQMPDKHLQTGEGNTHFEVLNLNTRESINFNIPFAFETE